MSKEKLKGKISISRLMGQGDDVIRIEVVDALSGAHFLEAEMSLVEFASAITGMGSRDCVFSLAGLQVIGKRREVKTEAVFVPCTVFDRDKQLEAVAKAVKPYEVDGWKANDLNDVNNMHRRSGRTDSGITVSMMFTRFVDASQE